MTVKDYELRLKVDASPAEAGAKRFTSAIASVKKAVQDLERSTDGAFSSLKNMSPKLDVTPITRAKAEVEKLASAQSRAATATDRAAAQIKQTMLASASAIRISEQSAQRLALRMEALGDVRSITTLQAALNQLHVSLANARTPLDVRTAKAQFDSLRSGLLQATVASEHFNGAMAQAAREEANAARATANHASTLESLRAKYTPLYAASQAYASALEEISRAESEGAVTAATAAQMRERAAQMHLAGAAAAGQYSNALNKSGLATQQGIMAGQQLSDVLITAQMGFQSVGMIALQQGSQLAAQMNQIKASGGSVFKTLLGGFTSLVNPISLITIAAVAGGAALAQWAFSAGDAKADSESLGKSLDKLESNLAAYQRASDLARKSTSELTKTFGDQAESVRADLNALAEHAYLRVVQSAKTAGDQIAQVFSESFAAIDRAQSNTTGGMIGRGIQMNMQAALESLQMTKTQAIELRTALNDLGKAEGIEQQRAAFQHISELLTTIYGSLERMPAPMRDLAKAAAEGDVAAAKMLASMNGSADAANNASSSAYTLTLQIGDAADAALTLLRNLNSAPAAIAAIGTSVSQQIASIEAQNRALTMALQTGISSAAANRRVQIQDTVAAAVTRAQRINVDQVAAQWNAVDKLDSVVKAQKALQDQLSSANKPAKRSGGGGGGGSSRAAASAAEESALERLHKSVEDRILGLKNENVALQLVANGQFKNVESAKLMVDAMTANGGAVDATTVALLGQVDALQKVNEALKEAARDPVREFMDSLPSWQKTGNDITEGVIGNIQSALHDLMTGDFTFDKLGEALLGTFADAMAPLATGELLKITGLDKMIGGMSDAIGGLGANSVLSTDASGVASGGAQAATQIQSAMLQAGAQVASQIQAAMTGGGAQASAQVRSGMTTGGAQAGLQQRAQITQAATTSAPTLAGGVVQGAQQAAPILGAGVASGSTSGGLLSSVGGFGGLISMALGAMSEGGYSTSPIDFTTAPISALNHAPHFSQGGVTSGGIPSILHPNEAVIPLTKGRKIPIDMGDSGNGSTVINAPQTFHISTPDADSFRRSKTQIASDMGMASQRAMRKNG